MDCDFKKECIRITECTIVTSECVIKFSITYIWFLLGLQILEVVASWATESDQWKNQAKLSFSIYIISSIVHSISCEMYIYALLSCIHMDLMTYIQIQEGIRYTKITPQLHCYFFLLTLSCKIFIYDKLKNLGWCYWCSLWVPNHMWAHDISHI